MKAMILAAGLGSRMQALTQHIPKPLVKVRGHCLIEYLLIRLAQSGFSDIVINVSHLGEKIISTLGNGNRYRLNIVYSKEAKPLGWGGGIKKALPLLGQEPFLVISGDLWTDYPFATLKKQPQRLAHNIVIDKPAYHSDFNLTNKKLVTMANPQYTYGGIGVFHPDLFQTNVDANVEGFCDFLSIVMPAINNGQVTGECYRGFWCNITTPACISALEQWLTNNDIKVSVKL